VSAEENVELARRGFEAFARGDFASVLELFDPDIEIYVPADLPNSGTFHGHDGYTQWVQNWLEAWDEYTTQPEEYRVLDEGHVLTVATQSGRGRGSGLEVSGRVYYLAEYREGKIVRFHLYLDEESAVAAAHG
jgi:ketosteroid isomerase-like protein